MHPTPEDSRGDPIERLHWPRAEHWQPASTLPDRPGLLRRILAALAALVRGGR